MWLTKYIWIPRPMKQILDSSKLKEFADDNLNMMKMEKSSPNG